MTPENDKPIRSVKNIPELGCHVENIDYYKVIDHPEGDIVLGNGVTREWVITHGKKGSIRYDTFIQHADTKEEAFDSFIKKFPDRYVQRLEYYGPYW